MFLDIEKSREQNKNVLKNVFLNTNTFFRMAAYMPEHIRHTSGDWSHHSEQITVHMANPELCAPPQSVCLISRLYNQSEIRKST